jgi:hypothetical protein
LEERLDNGKEIAVVFGENEITIDEKILFGLYGG